MYLVLIPERHFQTFINQRPSESKDDFDFKCYYTSSIEEVARTIRKYDGSKVYKLDSLTEIKGIDVTFQEVTKETENG